MKTKHILLFIPVLLAVLSCSKENTYTAGDPQEIRFQMEMDVTKATATAFEAGDAVSLWAVEQYGAEQIPLQIGGNYFNNEKLTYDGTKWSAAQSLYWSTSPCDFYALYPYVTGLTSVDEQPFPIAQDQNDGGYEASDLLWASAQGISRSTEGVRLTFRHLLSKCVVKIVKGDKFEGEIPDDIVVHIYNTTTSGKLDISQGSVTKDGFGAKKTITARKHSNTLFDAVLIPQNIEKRTPLIEVTMGGIAYLLEYSLSLRPGYCHTITLTVNTSPDQEMIEISIDADTGGWE